MVADRRKPDITAVPAATSRPGVYAWCGGPPRAGSRAFLAYNKVHGSSGGGLPHASSVRAHVGYDGWWNKITQVGGGEGKGECSKEGARFGLGIAPQQHCARSSCGEGHTGGFSAEPAGRRGGGGRQQRVEVCKRGV